MKRSGILLTTVVSLAVATCAGHAQETETSVAIPVFIHLMNRYVNDVSNRNEVEKLIAAEMDKRPGGKAALKSLVGRWTKIPLERRKAAFGAEFADLPLKRAFTRDELGRILRQGTDGGGPLTESGLEGPRNEIPPFAGSAPPRTRAAGARVLGVEFAGIYCRKETVWDYLSWEDEPYAIFVMSDGVRTWSRLSDVYQDVDTGEAFGPSPNPMLLFGESGPENPINITMMVTLMEHDEGDPNAHLSEIESAAEIGRIIATLFGIPIPSTVSSWVAGAINSLLGSDDDVIQSRTRSLTAWELQQYAARSPVTWRGLTYHSWTYHQGDGAKYYVMFRVF